jgi:hypothetical protein
VIYFKALAPESPGYVPGVSLCREQKGKMSEHMISKSGEK